MFPVLVSFGPVTIRSFGLFLMLAFLVCLFLVWKRAREEGLSEERVLDVFFLSVGLFFVVGRLWHVILNWQVFQVDIGRILLFFRYPGVSFAAGLLAGGVLTLLLAKLFQLSAILVLDIFVLGVTLATSFWYVGCFLDGCYAGNPWLPLVLAGVFVLLFLVLRAILSKIRRSPQLSELSDRPGFVTLWYLIFLCLSSLISSYTQNRQILYFSLAVLVISVIVFVVRYFKFLKGVKWSNFPKAFYHRSRDTLSRGGRILRRKSQS